MTKDFLKFSNYKTNTICVVVVFAMAFGYAKVFRILRFTDYRQAFFISVYLLHLITALCSFINAVYILRVVDFEEYKKYYWLVVNSIPILLWAGVFIWIAL